MRQLGARNGSFGVVCALIVFASACTDGAPPTTPTPSASSPTPRAALPPPAFPPLSRPGEIYRAPDSLYDAYVSYHYSSLASRYVLYSDGEFDLQFPSVRFPFFEYHGRYSVADSVFAFAFDDDSRWQATGILRGDALTVTYSIIASLSDFVDGVYVRAP
jgi:hypothetical protein